MDQFIIMRLISYGIQFSYFAQISFIIIIHFMCYLLNLPR